MRRRGKRVRKQPKDDSMDVFEWILTCGVLLFAILLIVYVTKDWGLFL